MTWGTPAPQAFDWNATIAEPAYNPDTYLSNNAHPQHAAWLAERDARLKAWDDAKDVLARAKETEMETRKAAQAFAFGSIAKEGMNNQPLANGFTLKFGKKLNYNLTASNDAIDAAEDKAGEIGNRGTFLFERIVVWKPEFSKSEYNKLDESDPTDKAVKALVDGLLTISEATGSLEIKEPKAKLNG